jgi:very-short-patch-repair endonuclease
MHARRKSSYRSSVIARRARQMRLEPTLSELRLWAALKGSALGVAFRRQVIVGERIVDFLAPSLRLVVEVDGAWHARRPRAEARRDRELERAGHQVLHLEAELIMHDLPAAVTRIREALARCAR